MSPAASAYQLKWRERMVVKLANALVRTFASAGYVAASSEVTRRGIQALDDDRANKAAP